MAVCVPMIPLYHYAHA